MVQNQEAHQTGHLDSINAFGVVFRPKRNYGCILPCRLLRDLPFDSLASFAGNILRATVLHARWLSDAIPRAIAQS